MSNDPRCAYLAQLACSMFNDNKLCDTIANAQETQQFVNQLNCKVLQILTDGKKCKFFAGSLVNPPAQVLEVHFIKVSEGSEELDPARIQF